MAGLAAAPAKNFMAEAAGSLGEARRLIIQHMQAKKIEGKNLEEFGELIDVCERLEKVRMTLEIKARISG